MASPTTHAPDTAAAVLAPERPSTAAAAPRRSDLRLAIAFRREFSDWRPWLARAVVIAAAVVLAATIAAVVVIERRRQARGALSKEEAPAASAEPVGDKAAAGSVTLDTVAIVS